MDKTKADKLMYIPNPDTQITMSVDCNWRLKRLDTQLYEPTNQNSLKFPKVIKPMNKKRYYKTLETSVINSQLSPLSLSLIHITKC